MFKKNISKRIVWLGLILAAVFLFIGVFTLSDYGLNVDESIHFNRGQAYLRYILTGKKNYSGLAPQLLHRGLTDDEVVEIKKEDRRSLFQSEVQDANWFLSNEAIHSGHPASSDVLAALTNVIFFQKLKVLGDLEAHHLFGLIVGAFLVFFVYIFAQEVYGGIAGLMAALALATYPLFLGESRFNVKDPPEAFFYTATLFSFWKGIKEKKAKYFLLFAFFFGWGMGTKFNIFFLAFTLLPWLLILFWNNIRHLSFRIPKKIIWALLAFPFVVSLIFIMTNPTLWHDPIAEFLIIVDYYRDIGGFGGARATQPGFLWHNFNLYPGLTVFYTTPLITLSLSIIGILIAFYGWRKEKYKTSLLILLWFLIPIIRVTLPPNSIYGGLRQIMEYIPAMALLVGLGAERIKHFLINKIHIPKRLVIFIFFFLFVPITIKMIKIHPNQNVYFNPLIGGLAGAAERSYPYAGNTMGNVYLQGIKWVNDNAEKDARLALPIGNITNLPWMKLREDIYFSNIFASNILRLGEYVMDTEQQGKIQNYQTSYYRQYVKPIYEVKVDNVPILKIWKNDKEHTYPGFLTTKEVESKLLWDGKTKDVIFDFDKLVVLERFSLNFESSCKEALGGKEQKIYYSVDGYHWNVETMSDWSFNGWTTDYSEEGRKILAEHDQVFLLAGRKARFLKIDLPKECFGKIENWETQILADFVNMSYSSEKNQLVLSGEINQTGEYSLVSSSGKFNPKIKIEGKEYPLWFDTAFIQVPLFETKVKFFQITDSFQLNKGNFSFTIPIEIGKNLLRNSDFEGGLENWSGGKIIKSEVGGEKSLLIRQEGEGKSFVYQKSISEFDNKAVYFISFDYKLLKGEAAVGIWQSPYPDYPQKPDLLTEVDNQWRHKSFLLKPEKNTSGLDFYLYSLARDGKGAEVFYRNLSVQMFTPDTLPPEVWLIKKNN
jgi:hypothetical protein